MGTQRKRLDELRTKQHHRINIYPRTIRGLKLLFEFHGYPVAYAEDVGYVEYADEPDF